MYKLWENYFKTFRELITGGWKVYRVGKSKVDYYVYTGTLLPTKFRMEIANEINNCALRFNSYAGTTRTIPYSCSLFFSTEECVNG